MKGISVVVCCYNSASKLPDTLKHLALQELSDDIRWEVIVVDNASTDNTGILAKEEWLKHGGTAPLTVVLESTPGLSSARHRGYEESKYDYILFCDDDNWLQKDYLRLSYEVMEGTPDVAIAGGRSEAAFETNAPGWFARYARSYAVGRQYAESGDVTWRDEKLWGAGAIYRKSALSFLYAHQFDQLLSDRIGKKIVSGGDHELCCALRLAGYRLYYDDRLFFYHFMQQSRLRWEWFTDFYRNASYSSIYFDAYAKVNRKAGKLAWLKEGALYEIYLSCRNIIKYRPSFKWLLAAPGPDAPKEWFNTYYEKCRMFSLFQHFFTYRGLLYKVRKAPWLQNAK